MVADSKKSSQKTSSGKWKLRVEGAGTPRPSYPHGAQLSNEKLSMLNEWESARSYVLTTTLSRCFQSPLADAPCASSMALALTDPKLVMRFVQEVYENKVWLVCRASHTLLIIQGKDLPFGREPSPDRGPKILRILTSLRSMDHVNLLGSQRISHVVSVPPVSILVLTSCDLQRLRPL